VLSPGSLGDLRLGGPDDSLDFRGVDQAGNIGVVDLGGGQVVILLLDGGLVEGTEHLIELGKSALSPDDEASDVTTRSQLKEVETADVADFNTGEVAESLYDAAIFTVDDERPTTLPVATITHLTLTSTKLAGIGDLLDISVRIDGLEEGNGLLGLLECLCLGCNDERNLLNLLDAMTTSENEGREGRSSESRDDGETALVLVDLDVPLAPGLGGSEHATTTAHVTERSLSRAVGTSTTDTGNTGDGATSTPRLGTGLVTSLGGDGIGLSAVLGDGLVDLLDEVKTDGSSQDIGQRERL
jgi:hypothetical protein